MTVKVVGDEGKQKNRKKIKQFRIVLDYGRGLVNRLSYSFYYLFSIPT